MDTIQLQQAVLQDETSLIGDTEAMKKLQEMLQTLKKEKAAKEATASDNKAKVMNDICQGLHELKLMKQGKLQRDRKSVV